MASQQGFEYEKNAVAYLKNYGLSDGIIAGASHTRPDLMLTVHGKQSGCELKISPTAGGSLVLKYYSKKTPHWQFGEVDHDETEKIFLSELATRSGVLQTVNSKWNIPPFLIEDRDANHEQIMLQIPLRQRYEADLKACTDVKLPLESSAMSNYYNIKNTYYINVGTHGFFLLGNKDPLGLNDSLRKKNKSIVPTFESTAKITARVRCQSKGVTKADAAEKSKRQIGTQGYQFTFTLEFSLATNASPYNIAPLASNGKSVIILTNKEALLDCLR
jgi:hypothetical protein